MVRILVYVRNIPGIIPIIIIKRGRLENIYSCVEKDKNPEEIPKYLCRIGNLMIKGLKELIKKHDLKIKIEGVPAIINLCLDYGKQNLAIRTLFTQEMLKRGFLASSEIDICYSFTEKHVNMYLSAADEVFAILKDAIKEDRVNDLLEGPVAHSKFERLT